jgi:hypothetical protein
LVEKELIMDKKAKKRVQDYFNLIRRGQKEKKTILPLAPKRTDYKEK